jgi:hypothetical protein
MDQPGSCIILDKKYNITMQYCDNNEKSPATDFQQKHCILNGNEERQYFKQYF